VVVLINSQRQRRPGVTLAVLDVDPNSSTYNSRGPESEATRVPHFGWNAVRRSAPTPPTPHVERRYLLVPG